MTIDTTNMCSHLQHKLFEEDGIYHSWGGRKPMMEMLGSGTQWIVAFVAMFIGNLPLLAWGLFFIAAAAGDIWMTWLLTKEDSKSMVLDHPTEAGFYIID